MKRLLNVALTAAALCSAPAFGQDSTVPLPYRRLQEEGRHLPQGERPPVPPPAQPEDRSEDLWYGTPGVRPGGDLLVPLAELIRKPSGLLDFKLRRVERYLPDRETAECFHDRW
jgi:hypothetical protein